MLLSVCLLSYNSAFTLVESIDSILNQDFKDFELIISDDCSTDNSWDIIKSYAAKHNNIIALRTMQNSGMAKNVNFALNHAQGKYLAVLHHDDLFSNDLFIKWVTLLEENKTLGMCFNDYSCKELNIKSIHRDQLKRNFNKIMKGSAFLKNDLLKYWGCSVWGSYIFKKSLWLQLNGFNENYSLLADVDFTMRLAAISDIGYVNEPLIDIKRGKPENYPEEYITFSWKRIFILFDIHSANINRSNYSNIFCYMLKRIVFRNKVSFEIIKWHMYSLYKKRKDIPFSYPNKQKDELFYSQIIRYVISKIIIRVI